MAILNCVLVVSQDPESTYVSTVQIGVILHSARVSARGCSLQERNSAAATELTRRTEETREAAKMAAQAAGPSDHATCTQDSVIKKKVTACQTRGTLNRSSEQLASRNLFRSLWFVEGPACLHPHWHHSAYSENSCDSN